MLMDEAHLVIERVNALEVTRAVILQGAIASQFSKEANTAFQEMLEDLNQTR